MADLGVIGISRAPYPTCTTSVQVGNSKGVRKSGALSSETLHVVGNSKATWRPSAVLNGEISGVTKVNGIVSPFHAVHVIDRRSGSLIRKVYSDKDGLFTIRRLEQNNPVYFVVMIQEPTDPGSYNAAVFDKVSAQ